MNIAEYPVFFCWKLVLNDYMVGRMSLRDMKHF